MRLVEREAIFIPTSDIKNKTRKKLIEKYTYRFYNEKACQSCEFLIERHSDICDNCAAFKGAVQLASTVKINDNSYLKLPAGVRPRLVEQLRKMGESGKIRVKDRQISPENAPFKRPIRFKYKLLKPFQKTAVKSLITHKKGVLKSPPRSGKTVMASALICKLGGKAMILASQRTWLEGFYETFCGSKTQKGFTDAKGSGVSTQEIREWQKRGRPHRSIGFCRTLEDFKRHDVCLVTYQTFLSEKGQKLLAKIQNMISVLVVDEVHTAAADKYAIVISKLNTKYTIGLSGTPSRKDQRYVVMDNLIGPIVHETKVFQLQPRVIQTKTKFVYPANRARWDQMVSSLENNPQRLKLIAETAVKDVKNGHMVLIPFTRVKVVNALAEAINRIAGKKIAAAFHGGISKDKRSDLVEAARKYRCKVLVGNSKMVSTGINIPRASMLYEVALSSNIENAIQRFKRILTPHDGKPAPTIRYFLDDMGVRRNCMRNEFWNALIPECKPIISDKDMKIMKGYFSNSKRNRIEL